MGLWDILTKDIKLGSHELSWSEPMLCRTRLRGDLIWRIVISVSAWLAASGIMLAIFAFNQNPPSRGVAFGLGAVFGLGPTVMILFMRKSQASGTIKLFRDRLVRSKMYAGITSGWTQTTTWELGGIACFHIVTADKAQRAFHVMFFKCDGEWDLIGIPRQIDLKNLRSVLSAGGADVKAANRVPDTFRKPLSPAVAGVSGVVGLALAVTGFLMFHPGNARNGRLSREIAQKRPDFPNPEFVNPGPVNPGVPGGNPAPQRADGIAEQTPALPGGFPLPDSPPNLFRQPAPPNSTPPGQPETSVSKDESIGFRSQVVGGTGGAPFTKVSAERKPVLGIRYQMGSWAGRERLGRIDPLFETIQPAPSERVVQARPGYALGAVEIYASDFVDGVRLVFMKQTADGQLDPSDNYPSDWIGAGGPDAIRLERDGEPIIGFHGRAVAIVDALGVVFFE